MHLPNPHYWHGWLPKKYIGTRNAGASGMSKRDKRYKCTQENTAEENRHLSF